MSLMQGLASHVDLRSKEAQAWAEEVIRRLEVEPSCRVMITVEVVKRLATVIKYAYGVKHAAALNLVATYCGFPSYGRLYEKLLLRDDSAEFRHHLWVKASQRQKRRGWSVNEASVRFEVMKRLSKVRGREHRRLNNRAVRRTASRVAHDRVIGDLHLWRNLGVVIGKLRPGAVPVNGLAVRVVFRPYRGMGGVR